MKILLTYKFCFVENLVVDVDADGNIKEYYPQKGYVRHKTAQLHRYGSGSFCHFSIHSKWAGASGVYALFIDGELVYIGQCVDLAKRFNSGYGSISPRNCFVGGQSTNCKMNKVILAALQSKKDVAIYFHETQDYNAVEHILIAQYKPEYNATR